MQGNEPISPIEREENEKAMMWLYRHGVTANEIRYFKWKYFDYEKQKVNINRTKGRGIDVIKSINYRNSPLVAIAGRNANGEKGKNIFTFYQTKVKKSQGFPSGRTYLVEEIEEICKTVENSGKLTIARMFKKPLTFSLLGVKISITR